MNIYKSVYIYVCIYIAQLIALSLSLLRSSLSSTSQNQALHKVVQAFERADLNQQSAMAASGEMRRASICVSDSVVCPKPRRIGLLNPSINDQIRPSSRWHSNHQTGISDSKAGAELLDIILTKGNYGAEKSNIQVASSPPPFFSGSPPSRASNPLIQDSQFGNDKFSPLLQAPISPSSSTRKGGSCVRMKFGHKPAAVRVEGFDCLSRDHRSISAVA